MELNFTKMGGLLPAVVQDDADADDRKADELALPHPGSEAFVAGEDELPGDAPAPDLVDELVGGFGLRLEVADDPAVLAGAAGLFLMGVIELDFLSDGFAIGHLGPEHTINPAFENGRRLTPPIRVHNDNTVGFADFLASLPAGR